MKNNTTIHYFWHLFVHIQRLKTVSNQSGYAMLITSILAILTFSMLSVYLFSTELYKSVASANVDAGTTFFAAESALNRRASLTRARFQDYAVPSGSSPGSNTDTIAARMSNCINGTGSLGSGDLGCVTYEYNHREDTVQQSSSGLTEMTKSNDNIKYRTYTFLRDITSYADTANTVVNTSVVPAGEPFAGLNMLDYRYRVYASAAKEVNNGLSSPSGSGKDNAAQTMLQMEFSSRQVPLFQFAAFYENDLEISSSTNMSITGPVHTNRKLWLAPGGNLTLANKVTSAGNMYKSLPYQSYHYDPAKLITLANGSTIDVSAAWATSNNIPFTHTDFALNSGQLTANSPELRVPDADKFGRYGTERGQYFDKSDLSVDFTPKDDNEPFKVIAQSNALSADQLLSLRQPVLAVPVVRNGSKTGEQTMLCPALPAAPSATVGTLSVTDQEKVRRSLQRALLVTAQGRLNNPISYSELLNPTATMGNNLTNALNAEGISTATTTNIVALSWKQVADLSGDCWLSAPMKITTQQDRREVRAITILQSDIKSLAVWNRDGKSLPTSSGTLTNTANVLYATNPAPATPAASDFTMEEMGMGASNTSDGGLVWHFSIEKDNTAKVDTYTAKNSPYGFAFTGGKYLPGPLSLVTNQAAYLQGDYNDARDHSAATSVATVPAMTARQLTHKKPAALMADTITVLSNACLDTNFTINCLNLNGPLLAVATSTGINAAFLTKTDNTVMSGTTATRQSGGLNNYIRMVETWVQPSPVDPTTWQYAVLSYTGSMISLGEPVEFGGRFRPGMMGFDLNGNTFLGTNTNSPTTADYHYFNPPVRNFNYDTSFNAMAGLPPLTPRAVYLKQKVFKRSYNAADYNVTGPSSGIR